MQYFIKLINLLNLDQCDFSVISYGITSSAANLKVYTKYITVKIKIYTNFSYYILMSV